MVAGRGVFKPGHPEHMPPTSFSLPCEASHCLASGGFLIRGNSHITGVSWRLGAGATLEAHREHDNSTQGSGGTEGRHSGRQDLGQSSWGASAPTANNQMRSQIRDK